MRRGEVWIVDFNPTRESEANKHRPAVIVSNDRANQTAENLGRGVLTVVPITSNVQHVFPFQVSIPSGVAGLSNDSKAQAEQVRAVSIRRIGDRIGELPDQLVSQLDDALRLHLAL